MSVTVIKKENVKPKIKVPSIKQIISGENSIKLVRRIHEIKYGKRKVKNITKVLYAETLFCVIILKKQEQRFLD